jgi:hypothetical protein
VPFEKKRLRPEHAPAGRAFPDKRRQQQKSTLYSIINKVLGPAQQQQVEEGQLREGMVEGTVGVEVGGTFEVVSAECKIGVRGREEACAFDALQLENSCRHHSHSPHTNAITKRQQPATRRRARRPELLRRVNSCSSAAGRRSSWGGVSYAPAREQVKWNEDGSVRTDAPLSHLPTYAPAPRIVQTLEQRRKRRGAYKLVPTSGS